MTKVRGKRILLTGAAAGIGAHVAQRLAEAGAELVLVDRDAEGLDRTAGSLRRGGAVVHTRVLDVTDAMALEETAAWAGGELGGVDVLINNAGIGHSDELVDTSLETWHRLMEVNFWAPLRLTYALLPGMRERGRGHVVNLSSGQALFPLPTWGAYATSKAALGTFSEALSAELSQHGVCVTTIYPYIVRTGFYDAIGARTPMQKLLLERSVRHGMRPERIARQIVRAIERDRRRVLGSPLIGIGAILKALPYFGAAAARLAARWLTRAPEAAAARRGAKPPLGFQVAETMSGFHEFEPSQGPPGKRPMSFRLQWGPDELRAWLSPSRDSFLRQPVEGTITADGLVEDAPCRGELELRYFRDRTIRYTFEFEAGGRRYRFHGEKVEIRPWNLPFSHTTCFGTLVDDETGRLVSRSITRFRMRTLPRMLASVRFQRREAGMEDEKAVRTSPAP